MDIGPIQRIGLKDSNATQSNEVIFGYYATASTGGCKIPLVALPPMDTGVAISNNGLSENQVRGNGFERGFLYNDV